MSSLLKYGITGFMLATSLIGQTAQALAQPECPKVVVIVSGGASVSPYTTPTQGCQKGYAAGSTDTFLRKYLLGKGHAVFTSPAMIGKEPVPATGDKSMGPFGNCPAALPVEMTVDSKGDIAMAGVHLANFIKYLVATHKVGQIDFVAHSMGGLYSRAAIAQLQQSNPALKINSLTTLATPWNGVAFANYRCNQINDQFCTLLQNDFASGDILSQLKRENIAALNRKNAGVLTDIPVTLIGADAFTPGANANIKPGDKDYFEIWPNDGVVNLSSQFAQALPDDVINHRRCYLHKGATHSIWVSGQAKPKMDDSTAITWNEKVASWVDDAIKAGRTGHSLANRQGCP